jgi:hypothetical protein
MDLEESRKRADGRFLQITSRLSPAGLAAFTSGAMPIDCGEGWLVRCDTYNNVIVTEYSPLRAYQWELAQQAQDQAKGAAGAERSEPQAHPQDPPVTSGSVPPTRRRRRSQGPRR